MRYYGELGFRLQQEIEPGVWVDQIEKRKYPGNTLRALIQNGSNQKVNDDLTLNHDISILADSFAFSNYSNIKYVELNGIKWRVSSVEIQKPRLILRLGSVYNE